MWSHRFPGIFTLFAAILLLQTALAQESIQNFTKPEKGNDYPGNDIPVNGVTGAYAATASACASICNAISSCVGFVYYPVTFTGDIYGLTGVTISAGSCYPKTSMVSPYAFPSGSEIYAYLRNSRCIAVTSTPTAGYCAGAALRYNVCAADAVAAQAIAASVTQVGPRPSRAAGVSLRAHEYVAGRLFGVAHPKGQ